MLKNIFCSKILIVDDCINNLRILTEALRYDYKIAVAKGGVEAISYLSRNIPDMILLDIMMPDLDGYELCLYIKSDDRTKDIPVIFLTGMDEIEDKTKGFEIGAVDYITKPFELMEVKARITSHLCSKKTREKLINRNYFLENRIRKISKYYKLVRNRSKSQLEIIESLKRVTKFRDAETGLHVKRISYYCRFLAVALGIKKKKCELIFRASPMHDIGKIGISDTILLKPCGLDKHEWDIMKTHTIIGGRILHSKNSDLLKIARTIALTHHEKWDGSGYPYGLKKDKIAIEGQITGICDIFDALTSDRPYKKAWSVNEAISEIESQKGKHFAPFLIDKFMKNINLILSIREKFTQIKEKESYTSN